jgi:hypothetical protein
MNRSPIRRLPSTRIDRSLFWAAVLTRPSDAPASRLRSASSRYSAHPARGESDISKTTRATPSSTLSTPSPFLHRVSRPGTSLVSEYSSPRPPAMSRIRTLISPSYDAPLIGFGTDGRPRPVIAGVLEAFEPHGLDGWEIALWFTTASGWLDDKRPVDLLTREPDQVVDAARHTFEEVDA